jgi:UDP-N-acetyl-D-galactosamine dehydrogenase
VLAGHRINDGMGRWVTEQLVLELARRRQQIVGARVLLLGLTFKEDCPDLRNTKVVDVLTALRDYGIEPQVVDPWVDPEEALREYGLEVEQQLPAGRRFGAVLALVPHQQFCQLTEDQWQGLLEPGGVLLDLKGFVPRQLEPLRL